MHSLMCTAAQASTAVASHVSSKEGLLLTYNQPPIEEVPLIDMLVLANLLVQSLMDPCILARACPRKPACAGPDRPLHPRQGATVPLQMAYMVRLGSFGFGSLPDMLCRMKTCACLFLIPCQPCANRDGLQAAHKCATANLSTWQGA